jgi:DNA-binding MarR family transcriptional regulator
MLHAQAKQLLMELALLLVEFAFYDAPTRLEHALVKRAEEDAEHMVWETHAELGRRIGIRREDVTKLLKPLKARGLIDYEQHRRGIQVLKLEKLARGE